MTGYHSVAVQPEQSTQSNETSLYKRACEAFDACRVSALDINRVNVQQKSPHSCGLELPVRKFWLDSCSLAAGTDERQLYTNLIITLIFPTQLRRLQ